MSEPLSIQCDLPGGGAGDAQNACAGRVRQGLGLSEPRPKAPGADLCDLAVAQARVLGDSRLAVFPSRMELGEGGDPWNSICGSIFPFMGKTKDFQRGICGILGFAVFGCGSGGSLGCFCPVQGGRFRQPEAHLQTKADRPDLTFRFPLFGSFGCGAFSVNPPAPQIITTIVITIVI